MQRLGLRHPIIQGPFGGGISTAKLTTAAVGELGEAGFVRLLPACAGRNRTGRARYPGAEQQTRSR